MNEGSRLYSRVYEEDSIIQIYLESSFLNKWCHNQNARYYGCCSYSPQLFIAIFFFSIFEFQI